MLSIALTLLAFHPQPLTLDNLGLDRGRILDGRRVLVSLLVGNPPYTWNGITAVDTDDRPDGVERTAVLVGKRFDVKEGKRIVVAGTLQVIQYPGRWVEEK
jgi:hypothetical protein